MVTDGIADERSGKAVRRRIHGGQGLLLAASGRIGAAEAERKRLAAFGPAITAPTENRQQRRSAATS
jgi:hypothetical protein